MVIFGIYKKTDILTKNYMVILLRLDILLHVFYFIFNMKCIVVVA